MTLSLALAALGLSLMGAAHCAAMCGGFVAAAHLRAQATAMHAGRVFSYSLIGGSLGAVGTLPFALAGAPGAHRVLFALACIALAASGLHMAGLRIPQGLHSRFARAVGRRASSLGHRIGPPDSPARAFALGALWGWAPCALVYAALPLALVSGSFVSGAIVMGAFGAGTLPALAGAGWLLARFSRPAFRAWIGGFIVVMAIVAALGALGPGVLPPFLCLD